MNMGLKHFVYLFLIAVVLLTSACLKRKQHVVEVNADMLGRYYYKPGSYWIMLDSISGRQDSFYITANTSTKVPMRTGLDMLNMSSLMNQVSADKTDTFYWEWGFVQSRLSLKVQSKSNSDNYYFCGVTRYPLEVTYSVLPLTTRYFADVNLSSAAEDSSAQSAGYSNALYINENDGLVKIRMNQPGDSERHFVWETVRRKIVL